ncbi:MAG: type II toxin-antitoxin system mRNA interferase toxin, RelE/StbE family [Candidatus Pacebacteria bacterium]|nr:type II toxin-antitoxin system mRNA interferase toxin, RelE/StbE family [Candidatus Paceibacterota bacterium]
MMSIILGTSFKNKYSELEKKIRNKFKERISIFIFDEFNPILNNHSLRGKYLGYRSINVSGDIRAIYKKRNNVAIFVYIDNYNNLYK